MIKKMSVLVFILCCIGCESKSNGIIVKIDTIMKMLQINKTININLTEDKSQILNKLKTKYQVREMPGFEGYLLVDYNIELQYDINQNRFSTIVVNFLDIDDNDNIIWKDKIKHLQVDDIAVDYKTPYETLKEYLSKEGITFQENERTSVKQLKLNDSAFSRIEYLKIEPQIPCSFYISL
jgi:hypothetical protein